MRYSLTYADPLWSYGNNASNGAATSHYKTMRLVDLKRLPAWELVAEDAVLAMWWVPPMPLEASELAQAWGFTVKNMYLFPGPL
jgi:N6-adenosine-specific RNA methylase IME4